MAKFNTIHIFGFGVVQVIGKDLNVQCPITSVQSQADACINEVWFTKPTDYVGTKDYHAINIFSTMFADWKPKTKGETPFRLKYNEINNSLFEALAQAVIDAQPKP